MPELKGEDRSYSDEISRVPFWKRQILTIMVSIAVVGGLSVLAVFTYEKGKNNTIPAKIKIIQAKIGPTKIKPKHPGGMIIPDQDKKIYSRLNPNVESEKVENLLPAPKVVLPKQEHIEHKPANKIDKIRSPKKIPDSSNPIKTREFLGTGNKSGLNSKFEGKSYRVQIASLRSEENVKNLWKKIKKKYPKLFQNLNIFIVRAEIKGKGTYFRLQLGPLKSSKPARELCQKIRTIKTGCFIVKPY